MPVIFDLDKCDGCGRCDSACPGDVIRMTRPEARNRKKTPVLAFTDECWHCGSCRQVCPEDAVSVVFPPDMLSI